MTLTNHHQHTANRRARTPYDAATADRAGMNTREYSEEVVEQ